MWEVSRVPFLGLFAQTELYLQLAHPAGAQGVFDHSHRLQEDPIRRFQSTFDFIWRMTYGTAAEAEKLSITLNRIHSHITGDMKDTLGEYNEGERYSANDPRALLWIHVTHWYAVLRTYEVFIRPLSLEEKNQFIKDTTKFGMMLGLERKMLPPDWASFKAYFDSMVTSGNLVYTPDALKLEKHFRQMSRDLERKAWPLWFVRKYADAITASTLPVPLARQFGLNRSLAKKALYASALKALRLGYRALPDRLKDLPLYRIAQARVAGRSIDPQDELLHYVLTGKRLIQK